MRDGLANYYNCICLNSTTMTVFFYYIQYDMIHKINTETDTDTKNKKKNPSYVLYIIGANKQ